MFIIYIYYIKLNNNRRNSFIYPDLQSHEYARIVSDDLEIDGSKYRYYKYVNNNYIYISINILNRLDENQVSLPAWVQFLLPFTVNPSKYIKYFYFSYI